MINSVEIIIINNYNSDNNNSNNNNNIFVCTITYMHDESHRHSPTVKHSDNAISTRAENLGVVLAHDA